MRAKTLLIFAVPAAVVAAAVGTVAALAGGSAGRRPVTSDEATRLALTRLTTYRASPAVVVLTAGEGGGVRVRVRGLIDYRARHGVGRYTVTGVGDGSVQDHGLIVWDERGLGIAPGADQAVAAAPASGSGAGAEPAGAVSAEAASAAGLAAHIPTSGWSPRAYTADPLDSGLRLLIGLAADRPDNPQLLAQSGARWLGRERIDGRGYDEFSGPRSQPRQPGTGDVSPLSYWVDGDGGLRRVAMRLPGAGEAVVAEIVGRNSADGVPTAPWAVP